jgi:predicted alpha/beta hydrolase family esterase
VGGALDDIRCLLSPQSDQEMRIEMTNSYTSHRRSRNRLQRRIIHGHANDNVVRFKTATSAWEQLTSESVIAKATAGTLNSEVVRALLQAAGMPA